jgi:glycerol-3-phosphate acyltransferase PlsY
MKEAYFFLLLSGGYLLGSVPAAYIAARWSRGIDIRKYGSGNIGAANVLATGSKWASILVIIFDLGKGMVVVYIAKLIGLEVYQQVIIGIAAIIGHNWPVFLGFNGGRGLLTTLGVVFILAPWLALILAVIAFAWAPFKQLALGTLLAMLLLPIFSWFLSEPLGIKGVKEALPLTLGFVAIFLLLIIRRLTAPKTTLTASVPHRQLLLNRLLFDRDLRDRETWLRRQPTKGKK